MAFEKGSGWGGLIGLLSAALSIWIVRLQGGLLFYGFISLYAE